MLEPELFMGLIPEILQGRTVGIIKGDTRSLDHSPHGTYYIL